MADDARDRPPGPVRTVHVRYRTRAEAAEENAALVAAVFGGLRRERPEGVRYSVLRLDDGQVFVHVAHFEGDDRGLTALPEFLSFQAGLPQRCVEPPVVSTAVLVGEHR